MAPPPRVRAFSRESVPGAPQWMDPLLQLLNEGAGQAAAALAGRLTFSENFSAELKTVGFTAPSPVWRNITYLNGWVSFDATLTWPAVSYRIDSPGRTWLQGMAKNGAILSAIGTLPLGYRPVNHHSFAVDSNTAFGRCSIFQDGSIMPNAGSATYFSVDGISFITATPAAPDAPTTAGWPISVATRLQRVAGVLPVRTECLDGNATDLAGSPSFDWIMGSDHRVQLRNATGLVPGRRYKSTLLLFAG